MPSHREHRPDIRESDKREIRKRCGFGCIICGLPIYEYHHMDGYNHITKEHCVADITLLCSNHHTEVTHRLRTRDQIRRADQSSWNHRHGHSACYHIFNEERCPLEIYIGNNRVLCESTEAEIIIFTVDALPLLKVRFEEGHPLLSMLLLSENNDTLVSIDENALCYKVSPWDVEFVGKTLTVRKKSGDIALCVEFEPPSRITFKRARFFYNDKTIQIRRKGIVSINGEMEWNLLEFERNNYILIIGSRSEGIGGCFHLS